MPTPQTIPDTFDRLAADMDLARSQCTKPKHLYVNLRRAAIQAGRLTFEAIEANLIPSQGFVAQAAALSKRPVSDAAAWGFWCTVVVTWLAAEWPSRVKADSSAFDHPEVKTDASGRPIDRDGKTLKYVEYTDPKTGRRGWKLNGTLATVVDDYDGSDTLEHLRIQAINYADTCRTLAGLVREQIQTMNPPDDVQVQCMVTLSQMAAVVSRTKKTLERYKSKLPAPKVKGGKGKPDEWEWSEVRPVLEEHFGRRLPNKFPAARIL